MKHPVLYGNGYKVYGVVWNILSVLHFLILYFYYELGAAVAIGDSLVFNFLFSFMAVGLWYIVAYGSAQKDELATVGLHVGAALILIIVWTGLSFFLLKIIFQSNLAYIEFLDLSYVWRIVIGGVYYIGAVLVFYLIKYYQDMEEKRGRELELENLLKDAELKMLKSQINPHFIFNSLNSISALTVTKPQLAREMVIKLSEFLRYSLGKDSKELNALDQEIDNVSLYLEIERIRFGDRLKFEKKIGDSCKSVLIPNLILQPLFENAIKYGVYDSLEDVTIRLECEPDGEFLILSIRNNFDPDAVSSKGEGIGLQSVRKRLSLVFGRNDLLQVNKTDNIFIATLKIPNHSIHE